jgi:predicted NUDIX family NTP pyrophosphohydrolase
MSKRRADLGKNSSPKNLSAGLLLFRRIAENFEVFLAHPDGPFWALKNEGAWTIPKGLVEQGEEPLIAAQREFQEETGIAATEPFLPLGSVQQKAGKVIQAWAFEGDAVTDHVKSNLVSMKIRGEWKQFPEIDRCGWFSPNEARKKLNPAQVSFVERLEMSLGSEERA